MDGRHEFSRFNPAAGLTWRFAEGATAYAGYSEANRAPSPAELSCADPLAPCSLTNFFVGDPPLKQVKARTVEAGVRGRIPEPDSVFGGKPTRVFGYYARPRSGDGPFPAMLLVHGGGGRADDILATAVPGFPVWDLAGLLGSTLWAVWLLTLGALLLRRAAPARSDPDRDTATQPAARSGRPAAEATR